MSFNEWPEPTAKSPVLAPGAQTGSAPSEQGQPVPPIVQAFIAASERLPGEGATGPGAAAAGSAAARIAPKPSAAPIFNIGSEEDLIQLEADIEADIQSVDGLSDEVFPGASQAGEDEEILRAVQEIEKAYCSGGEHFVPPRGSVQEGGQLAVPALYGTEGPLSMDRAAAFGNSADGPAADPAVPPRSAPRLSL